MTTLPSLIINYLNDCLLYHKTVSSDKLFNLCLVKLSKLYLPLKKDLTIEEMIDAIDGN